MKNILLTGATGNVSRSVVKLVSDWAREDANWILAVRSPQKLEKGISDRFEVRTFDFEDEQTYAPAFFEIDVLFLLRPPHIADAEGVFRPVLAAAKKSGVKKVVFLSVQGADRMPYIPHAKIEKIIIEMGFNYVFLRPSYFMQNLLTTLRQDLQQKNICLPAGKALFNWVDVDDVAFLAAETLLHFDKYINRIFTVTGSENLSFGEVAGAVSAVCGVEVKYTSMNLWRFFLYKYRQGEPVNKILVMIMLHYFPHFGKSPSISLDFKHATGKVPTTLNDFLLRNKSQFSDLK